MSRISNVLHAVLTDVLPVVIIGGGIVIALRERQRRAKAAALQQQPWPELPEESVAVTVPSLGEGVVSATIVRVIKSVGDCVALNDPVAEVSTDKVDTEVAATVAGVVTGVLVHPGQEVPVGFPILAVGRH
jgi:2-oxoglutarate dehydrogenase E2 component (dihydrolipoamide succinyltransferase)